MNPIRELERLGQSIWLDDIRRGWLKDGTFARWVSDDGISGVTSNPAIFEKAIDEGGDYDPAIGKLGSGRSASDIYETLALEDVTAAAGILRHKYDQAAGVDGFVSFEVSPHLAHDTEATINEARRLWQRLNQPNIMIKVPGTKEGLPAIRRLLAEGINVNVTLLFGLERYRQVVEAFLTGLEDRVQAGQPLERMASVASFFLSRIDAVVDPRLAGLGTSQATALRGKAAIASARLGYDIYREWTGSDRWKRLAARGAHPQRLLWASTSTKDPSYPDTLYVDALIGPDTVNTLPRSTLDAYRDHGRPAVRLTDDLDNARQIPDMLRRLGIDLEAVSLELEAQGIRKFIEPYEKLLASIEKKRS